MRKTICLLLTMMLTLSFLIGCGTEIGQQKDSETTGNETAGQQTDSSNPEETGEKLVKLQFTPNESKEAFYGEQLSGTYLPFQTVAVSPAFYKATDRMDGLTVISSPEDLTAWMDEKNPKGMEALLNLDPNDCVILIFQLTCSSSDALEFEGLVKKGSDLVAVFCSNVWGAVWAADINYQYFAVAVQKNDFDFNAESGELFYSVYCEAVPEVGSHYYKEPFPYLHEIK